jgi:hypothetical protein
VLRLRVDEPLFQFGGVPVDRLAQRLQPLVALRGVWSVLRGILPDLLEGIDEGDRILCDVVEFIPQPVEMGALCVVEHEARELIVLAVKEG